jgi:hypothetical protein
LFVLGGIGSRRVSHVLSFDFVLEQIGAIMGPDTLERIQKAEAAAQEVSRLVRDDLKRLEQQVRRVADAIDARDATNEKRQSGWIKLFIVFKKLITSFAADIKDIRIE